MTRAKPRNSAGPASNAAEISRGRPSADSHDEAAAITRFDRVQEFASYARLVKCQKQSGGKTLGTSGAKMGNVHLKWAFSEAAVLFLRHTAEGKTLLARLEKTHGTGKALSILAHTIGRAVYDMRSRGAFTGDACLTVPLFQTKAWRPMDSDDAHAYGDQVLFVESRSGESLQDWRQYFPRFLQRSEDDP